MHLKYFYPWGYFFPVTCGTDRVAVNHFTYFRERGWSIELIVVADSRKTAYAERFREQYPWLQSITEIVLPPSEFAFRDLLFAYEQATHQLSTQAALSRPADLFLTNYAFSSPLLQHVPRSCKRVLETHDILSWQFALNERNAASSTDIFRTARAEYCLRTELECYGLYDAVSMINCEELEFVKSRQVTNATYVPQLSTLPVTGSRPRVADYDLLFVGSDAPINVKGMTWFYHNVYVPYLWRHRVRLAVVGNICRHLDISDAHVSLLSRVEGSLNDLYASAKVVVVPIFEGTGLSIKSLEALAMGRALVVTPKGARGLAEGEDAYVQIDMKADPRETANAILDLLGNPSKRRKLEQAALSYARRCFGREAFFGGMDQLLQMAGLGTQTAVRKDTIENNQAWTSSGAPVLARAA